MSGIDQLAKRIIRLEKKLQAASTTPQLANSSIENGAVNEYDIDGNLYSRTGAQHDGTHGSFVLGGPPPPTPTAPSVEPMVGGAKIRWDGMFIDDAMCPMDFARVEVHVSNRPNFTPDLATTLVATIETPRGTEVPVPLSGGSMGDIPYLVGSSSGSMMSGDEVHVPVPATVAAGDLMVMVAGSGHWATALTLGGWANIGSSHQGWQVSAVWTKRATADDLGSTVTIAVANSTATSPSAAVLRAYRNAADIATAVAAVSADTSTVHATPVVTVDAMPVLVLEAASVRASPLGALQPPPADASPVTQMGAAPANPGGTGVSTAERVYDEGISVGGGAFTHDANVADATAWTLVLTSQSQSTHYYVKLVAKSLAGKASVPSAMAVASPSSINVDEGGLGSVAGTVQSPGYVVGESGYRFSEQDSQVPALNVISELGAGSVSADSVQLGADDLRELLDALPRGAIAFTPAPVDGTTGNTAEIGTTEVVCYDIAVGSVYTGRRHHIWCHGHLETDGEVGAYDLRMRYTTDGSTPGNGSPVLPGGTSRINFPSTSQSSQAFAVHSMYSPTVDYDNLRIAVTLVRAVGAGTAQAHIYGHNTDRRFELVVEDMGLDANIGGTIAQKSKEAGTVDPPPKATYTRTWNATWTRSFDSDGSARTPDTNDLYQGYISGTHGNTRSLVGFNYSDIQSKLSGSTINSIKLIYRVKHQGWGTGLDLDIGTHTYASRTSAWSSSNVSMDRGAHDNSKEGVTYTVNLPVAIGNDFRSGAARGIAIGPADANNIERYGYLYGYGSAYPPKIKITYTK